MKTKIVYVVISDANDCYFEQVWASAWSLRHYNPDAHVVVLTDEATKDTIYSDARKEALNYIDEVVIVEFDGEYNNMERSRWIKTNMRDLIAGDFLFIDADTIICGSLSDIDNWTCSIGAVLDSHCHAKDNCDNVVFQDMYVNRLKLVYNAEYHGEDVFNSGVMFVKDDEKAHVFFDTWHRNWLLSRKKGFKIDQLSLLKTNIELDFPIAELPGEYNCQIPFSIQYLTRALIVHTFAHQRSKQPISVIMGNKLYMDIKQVANIDDNTAQTLLHCKETFTSPSYIVGKDWIKLRFQPAYFLMEETFLSKKKKDKIALGIINFIARSLSYILRKIK